jgi:membrane-associated phospholipid phosphatase
LWTVEGRSADGANTQVPYIPSDAPGQWRRTPPFFRPPIDPHWRYVDPFCLLEIEPFVPPPPPALDSPEYAADVTLVQELGAAASPTRTPEQTLMASFWSDFSYTATPAGHWQEIASAIAASREISVVESARLFALLSLAQADAAIVAWEAKYRYNFWRPVTAIQRADEDDNPATEPDPEWESLLVSPSFPEYVSGHSTFSGASATLLAGYFGTDQLPFTIGADALPGVFRSFDSVWACAEEVGMSRIYGGIHFPSANREGKECGRRVAMRVLRDFLLPTDRLPQLFWESGNGVSRFLRVHGRLAHRAVIEESMDLQNWEEIAAHDAVPGGFVIEVAPITGSCFYRVREE